MFYLLFSDAFSVFIDNIVTFPTVIFTALVLFVMLYWVVSMLGFMGDSLEISDGDLSLPDVPASDVGGLAGILLKFGLNGVPTLMILTLVSLSGWVFSYVFMKIVNIWFATGVVHYLFAILVLLLVLWLSLCFTGLIVKPFREKFATPARKNAKTLLGKIAVVRTLTVDDKYGEAVLEDGGAGLILKVRAFDTTFSQGDRVLLTDYFPQENSYKVVAESKILPTKNDGFI